MIDEATWVDGIRDIFGGHVVDKHHNRIEIDGVDYPIIDGVVVLLDPNEYPPGLRRSVGNSVPRVSSPAMSTKIQESFSYEWEEFSEFLPEYAAEFRSYFDLIDLDSLRDSRVCDLGCGTGRWAHFVAGHCRQLILVDFSDAIFVARANLRDVDNAYFFLGDLTRLPFRDDFADFIYSLGVLHHLPSNALDQVIALQRFAPKLLIYLYYSLDNKGLYFRLLFRLADLVRRRTSRISNLRARSALTWLLWATAYVPLITLGKAVSRFGHRESVPLYAAYAGKSVRRVRQDVYDRFFTSIEQRFSRADILALGRDFRGVTLSAAPPYWHFICDR